MERKQTEFEKQCGITAEQAGAIADDVLRHHPLYAKCKPAEVTWNDKFAVDFWERKKHLPPC